MSFVKAKCFFRGQGKGLENLVAGNLFMAFGLSCSVSMIFGSLVISFFRVTMF
jgi:hypothetical protein